MATIGGTYISTKELLGKSYFCRILEIGGAQDIETLIMVNFHVFLERMKKNLACVKNDLPKNEFYRKTKTSSCRDSYYENSDFLLSP